MKKVVKNLLNILTNSDTATDSFVQTTAGGTTNKQSISTFMMRSL